MSLRGRLFCRNPICFWGVSCLTSRIVVLSWGMTVKDLYNITYIVFKAQMHQLHIILAQGMWFSGLKKLEFNQHRGFCRPPKDKTSLTVLRRSRCCSDARPHVFRLHQRHLQAVLIAPGCICVAAWPLWHNKARFTLTDTRICAVLGI